MIKRFFTFRNYLIPAIGVSLVLTFFAKQYAFFAFDLYITRQIQSIEIPVVNELLLFITWLGNSPQAIISLIAVMGAFFLYGLKKESLMLGVSAVGAVAISETLKVIVLRPRPDPVLINQIEKFFRADSFPSGHVLFFCGFYGFIMFLTYTKLRNKNLRNLLSGFFLWLIILVGISRVYLGSHWFSDTLAAYLIGSIWLYLVVVLYKKFEVQSVKDGK